MYIQSSESWQTEEVSSSWGQYDWLPYGGFHKWEYPQMDGLEWETPIKMDDLGVPLF